MFRLTLGLLITLVHSLVLFSLPCFLQGPSVSTMSTMMGSSPGMRCTISWKPSTKWWYVTLTRLFTFSAYYNPHFSHDSLHFIPSTEPNYLQQETKTLVKAGRQRYPRGWLVGNLCNCYCHIRIIIS